MNRYFLASLIIYILFLISLIFYINNIFNFSKNKNDSYFPLIQEYKSSKKDIRCGIKGTNRYKRIINGIIVNNSIWPWDVKIYYYESNRKKRLLGSGTIVHSRFVITSSSSFDSILNKRIYIINDYICNKVLKTISHPDYKSEIHSKSPNVALLLLERSIEFDESTKPVCLPKENLSLVNKDVYVTGWGFSNEGAHRIFLRETKLKVLSNTDKRCDIIPNDYYYCVFDIKKSSAPCFGDSNLYYSINRTWYLFGVIGFFKTNSYSCLSNKTSYFSKVYQYLTWIENNIREIEY